MSDNSSELDQRLNQETQLRLEMQRKHEEELARLEMHKRLQVEEMQMRANMQKGAVAPTQSVVINNVIQNNVAGVARQSLGFIIRLLYFVFIGWWFGFVWFFGVLALCCTVIGIPIGLLMLTKASEAFFLW